mmetsp:Transcript_47017/g.147330  ORF Transcript_47017/g.147330 Transcript_47017/m.147330 type:complete len:224 (+) Transcript_47017:80-751(+)
MASGEPLTRSGRGPDGLFPKSDFEKIGLGSANLFTVYNLFAFVFGAPGAVAAAAAIFLAPCPAVLEKVSLLRTYYMAPLYFTILVVQFAFLNINANLSMARRPTRVNVPDQHVYRAYGGAADGTLVFMHDDGDFGTFNRAQRALANFEEALPLLILNVFAAAFVFPWAVLVTVVFISIFRVKGAIDYTTERTKRITGNMASNILASSMFTANIVIGVAAMMKA